VNYASPTLPAFTVCRTGDAGARTSALSGRIRLARDVDGIERAFDAAKYGGVADEPWIELTIPSIGDPSLAPRGPARGFGVTSSTRRINSKKDGTPVAIALADAATRTIERYAPGLRRRSSRKRSSRRWTSNAPTV